MDPVAFAFANAVADRDPWRASSAGVFDAIAPPYSRTGGMIMRPFHRVRWK
jgi:hypothetical protein